jgi:hypothetical protein
MSNIAVPELTLNYQLDYDAKCNILPRPFIFYVAEGISRESLSQPRIYCAPHCHRRAQSTHISTSLQQSWKYDELDFFFEDALHSDI